MGFRDGIKKGGGFLNNVDGTITGYEFTDRFKGEKKGGEWVYFVPTIKIDGADDEVDQHFFMGAAERYTISKDGKSIEMAEGGNVSWGFSTPFGLFTDSLIEAGFPEAELPDVSTGEALNLEAIVDRRFTFKQQVDVEGTKKRGKRVVGQGKNKREYDRTNTVIAAVLGESKGSKSASSSKAKGKAKDEDDDEEDLTVEALAALKTIIKKEGGSVNRRDLSLPVTKFLMKNENKDELKALMLDEDQQAKWEDAEEIEIDKKGNISLP